MDIVAFGKGIFPASIEKMFLNRKFKELRCNDEET
jgi:hypothetical protein